VLIPTPCVDNNIDNTTTTTRHKNNDNNNNHENNENNNNTTATTTATATTATTTTTTTTTTTWAKLQRPCAQGRSPDAGTFACGHSLLIFVREGTIHLVFETVSEDADLLLQILFGDIRPERRLPPVYLGHLPPYLDAQPVRL